MFDILARGKQRRYLFAEIGFFKMWWEEQSDDRKGQFQKYVNENQFKFVSGGWVTSDEACTYYEDIIDQFILGHRWLMKNFGLSPSTGWQIDPFGHSKSHAALMPQLGINSLFIGRIDYQDL